MQDLPIVRLRESLQSLLTCLRGAASDVERTLVILDEEVVVLQPHARPLESQPRALILDRKAFAVSWGSKTCYLGYSILYRVMDVLASHPNQYVSHRRLLDLAWHGPRSDSKTVRHLAQNNWKQKIVISNSL